MTRPSTHPSRLHTLTIAALVVGCGDASSRGSPDLGGPTTGDPGGPGSPTPGPGGPGETPTTGAPTTGGPLETTTSDMTDTTSSTGEPGPSCGDGVLDPGEACDNGAANSDNAFCTMKCNINYCGDGNVLVGWEICDEGGGNSDTYGSLCGAECEPGPRCGDHIVQPEEECDLGPDNGGLKGDEQQGILCDAGCNAMALRAFVTSQEFSGDLGGISGADAKCQGAADAAGLPEPERFHAYLSTPDSPANARFPGPAAVPLPYVLVTGKKLADSHAKLLYQGPLGDGLSVTELGTTLYDKRVATNTTPGGNSDGLDRHCLGWTSADPLDKAGAGYTFPADPDDYQAWVTDAWWVSQSTLKCAQAELHLYCLEI